MDDMPVPGLEEPDLSLTIYEALAHWMEDSGPYNMVDLPTQSNPYCP